MMMLSLAVATSGCARLLETTGKVGGNVAGTAAANAAPAPKASVVVNPKGGAFCSTLEAMGAPFDIRPTDAKPSQEAILNIDEHGAAYCGWKTP